jgi:nicotinamidase-related amidase
MLQKENAALVVIDFQDRLLPKISNHEEIMEPAIRLIRFARELGIPILWTEQYPKGLGPTNETIAKELTGLHAIDKTEFGCMANPGFAKALEESGRKQLVITGIEAHICVMQTVLSAIDKQYKPFVAMDAIGSRDPSNREAGIHRMEKAGAEMVTSEMAMFEILQQAGTPDFKKVLPLLK